MGAIRPETRRSGQAMKSPPIEERAVVRRPQVDAVIGENATAEEEKAAIGSISKSGRDRPWNSSSDRRTKHGAVNISVGRFSF
jgi:hypothetical protein